MSGKFEYTLFGLVLYGSENVADIQLRHELNYSNKTVHINHICVLRSWKGTLHRERNRRTEMRIRTGLTDTLQSVASTAQAFTKISPYCSEHSSRHSHCNVSDKGFWTGSSCWVIQYTLARRIPTHPTFPAFLQKLPSVKIRELHCSRAGESGGKNNACNANDKPANWVHHPPDDFVRRGSHEGVYGN
jgi:hypothetical protein